MPDRDVPKKVDEYVEQIKEKNPSYDEAQVWATAWSIYCKYKNPGSDHCQQPTADYFPGKGGDVGSSPLSLRRDYGSREASTGQKCEFYKARDGKWYMGLSRPMPDDPEDRKYWSNDIEDWYGPFDSEREAQRYLARHFPNPGGSRVDDSGRRPPPRNPESPDDHPTRWASMTAHWSVKQASTGQECQFYKARDGKWYMGLSDYPPEDDEEREYWSGDIEDWYGPFGSFDEAYKFLDRNFANPGGYIKDDSGRRPPPRKPHSPNRRWASATERVVARYKAQRRRG